ncbi:ribonuclease P protein component [Haliea sp. E17]|uniref:ribonuclease P protein component n=1 Tax=Haliea sp. E17 TaxID=3401576 RepID=UPI003AAB7B07
MVQSDCHFSKRSRLLNAGDYQRVFNDVKVKAGHKHLLLLATYNQEPGHRLGLVIAKRNVRLAVQRNRIKRVAREFFRHLPASQPPMDVILLARQGMDCLDNDQLSTILRQQWQKLSRNASRSLESHDP